MIRNPNRYHQNTKFLKTNNSGPVERKTYSVETPIVILYPLIDLISYPFSIIKVKFTTEKVRALYR
jgi:hypothetical protein